MHVQLGPGGFARAVDLVAETRDAGLGALVGEALQGCEDAAQWRVRLQAALGQREVAAELALAIAADEQPAGNYKVLLDCPLYGMPWRRCCPYTRQDAHGALCRWRM